MDQVTDAPVQYTAGTVTNGGTAWRAQAAGGRRRAPGEMRGVTDRSTGIASLHSEPIKKTALRHGG
jgi:hypothetical protein